MNSKQKKVSCRTPVWSYRTRENWLSQMALQGWRLIECNSSYYIFVSAKPQNRIYYFSFYTRNMPQKQRTKYANIGVQYGRKQKRSDEVESGDLMLHEADPEKIDADFISFLQWRNHLIVQDCMEMEGVFACFTAVWTCAFFIAEPSFSLFFLFVFWSALLLNSLKLIACFKQLKCKN